MLHVVNVENRRLKFVQNRHYQFWSRQYNGQKQDSTHHWIIFIKLIYTAIFICFTIFAYLNQSINDNIEYPKTVWFYLWDIWYSFLSLILILSLFIDCLKQQNRISFKMINAIQILLLIATILIIISGHIQAYHYVWWSSNELLHSTLFAVILIDMCPISIAIITTINSLKTRQFRRRIYPRNIVSSV